VVQGAALKSQIDERPGNFREPKRTDLDVHVVRLLPASIRRAFQLMWLKLSTMFGDAPILFFAVVIGVALTFRFAVGAVREASVTPDVAPTFATGADPATSTNAKPEATKPSVDPTTKANADPIGEVGAAAKVQPIGAPARVAPKVRGHGRRPIRGDHP
jgi:hypothetical protein